LTTTEPPGNSPCNSSASTPVTGNVATNGGCTVAGTPSTVTGIVDSSLALLPTTCRAVTSCPRRNGVVSGTVAETAPPSPNEAGSPGPATGASPTCWPSANTTTTAAGSTPATVTARLNSDKGPDKRGGSGGAKTTSPK
jgi:hypothetical protein